MSAWKQSPPLKGFGNDGAFGSVRFFPQVEVVSGPPRLLRFAVCAVRFWNVQLLFPLSLFTLILYAQFPWPSLSSSRCLCAAWTRAPSATCLLNTCKALGGSMNSCIAGRGARDKRRPSGRKDVGYEICSFYWARRLQWRANGTGRLKSFAERGPNIKLNHRHRTHSSHSNCPLNCCTQRGPFQLESHSSFKMPCKHTDRMETRPRTSTLGRYLWQHSRPSSCCLLLHFENFYCFLQNLVP